MSQEFVLLESVEVAVSVRMGQQTKMLSLSIKYADNRCPKYCPAGACVSGSQKSEEACRTARKRDAPRAVECRSRMREHVGGYIVRFLR
jgi:hypothetical protein